MAETTLRYTYRIRPGRQAEQALDAEWNRCRWLWNEAVHQKRTGRKPTVCRLSKLLTEARSRFGWLRDGSQVAQQQTLRTYMAALDRSYKVQGCGRPAVKRKRSSLPTLEYTTRGFTVRDGRLTVAGGIGLPVVWSRPLPSPPTSVRIYQDSLGHWYASFVVRRAQEPLPDSDKAIGIDWGVRTTATTTNPAYDLPYAGHRKRCAAELAKVQRKMARRRRPKGSPPSGGYRTARREAAKVQKKAARQARHDGLQWANRVVAEHGLLAVEDFKPKFLAQSTMARKASDAAIGTVKRTLIEQAQRAGRTVVMVPPAYTTMDCSSCGARAKQRLDLSERTFVCHACGLAEDRDRNAARVILARAGFNPAGAEAVSHRDLPPGLVSVLAELGSPRL